MAEWWKPFLIVGSIPAGCTWNLKFVNISSCLARWLLRWYRVDSFMNWFSFYYNMQIRPETSFPYFQLFIAQIYYPSLLEDPSWTYTWKEDSARATYTTRRGLTGVYPQCWKKEVPLDHNSKQCCKRSDKFVSLIFPDRWSCSLGKARGATTHTIKRIRA